LQWGQHVTERKSIYRPSASRDLVRAASPEFSREGCCRLRREPFRPHELFPGTRNNATLAMVHGSGQSTYVSPLRSPRAPGLGRSTGKPGDGSRALCARAASCLRWLWPGQLPHPPDFTAGISVATDPDGVPQFGSSKRVRGTGTAVETFKQTYAVDLPEAASET
jgi:hypothetical protein